MEKHFAELLENANLIKDQAQKCFQLGNKFKTTCEKIDENIVSAR